MELFHHQTKFDFMAIRKWTAMFSILVAVCSILLLTTKGLNVGLDFTGGTQLELRYQKPVDFELVKDQLEKAGFQGPKVTQYGSVYDVLVKVAKSQDMDEQMLSKKIVEVLATDDTELQLRRVEFVGAEVGAHLAEQGAVAVLVALLATMLYIAMRFEYRFGLSAMVALLHDPILILGFFSFLEIEFDLASLAAILAVLGYSLNDTIVVYDRVRENFRKMRKATATEIMNLSINQTLSRTIMTSVLTLLVVVALFLFGGESLRGFSLALIVGIVIGTYSSIFVAGAMALSMGLSRKDLVVQTKKVVDDLP